MLVFIACVKHPDNSDSYEEVWRYLNNTLFSVCSQQDTDFRVIVVCDKQMPLYHHQELINTYTEFVEVDFPSHSEEVIHNFDRLGNLSSPLEDLKWWGIQNDYQTAIELSRGSNKLWFKFLERLVGKTGIRILVAAKANLKTWLNKDESSKQIARRDYLHIANVVLNMGTKLLVGILAAKKYAPEYVMLFDADDYVGKDISAYVNSHPGENGWIMAHGYKMAGKRIAPFYRWNSVCGTGNILRYSLLSECIGIEVSETSSQDEIFQRVDSEFILTIGRHDKPRSYFEAKGKPLLEYPTSSVIHLVGHSESSEYTRSIIRGEAVDRQLKEAKKFGPINTISSTQIDYFNVLPTHSVKVFCLGFQKTATTSVDWVLQDMGYQVSKAYKQPDIEFVQKLKMGDLSEIKQVSKLFDAFQDIPWFNFYKEFDRWYPGSKFILTTRETNSWWNSFLHYFQTENYPLFEFIYGAGNPIGKEQLLKERYESHNRKVVEYFKDRPNDLLVLDVSEDQALEKITSFLGKKSSYTKMPHKNAILQVPLDNKRKLVKKILKESLNVRFRSIFKFLSFSAPPIIIGGCRKSGVKLMLSILSCHPSIHPVRNLRFNHRNRHPLYPDRTVNANQKISKNKSPINQKSLISRLFTEEISLSAKRWCGANAISVLKYDEILKQYGNKVRIINMVRDGRDVIVEHDKKVMEKYVVDGDMWVYDIKAGIKYENHPQVLTIRYEDLIHNYEETINRICEFIEEKDTSPLLAYPKGAVMITDKYWIGKWQQPQFSSRIKDLLQTPGALDYLKHYGYIEE